jgi:hypothetical protein
VAEIRRDDRRTLDDRDAQLLGGACCESKRANA